MVLSSILFNKLLYLIALETVGCIADEGVNAVLLVLKLDRISQAEGEFAKKTLTRIFGNECQEKILLVITNCEDNLVEKPEDQKKWLDQNAKDAGSNFKNYFALVGKNPEKVIFVNNTNPATVSFTLIFFNSNFKTFYFLELCPITYNFLGVCKV